MDLARYLLFTRRLTRWEYEELCADQRAFGLGNLEDLDDGFIPTGRVIHEIEDLGKVREIPFGEILRNSRHAETVLRRAGKTLEQLVDEWYDWHCLSLEPICNYSTTCKFGRELYSLQEEKKLVAEYVVAARAPDQSTLIADGDTVIITEGTSTAYVGMAIAAARSSVRVITLNGALISEYRANPAIARRLGGLHVVGGIADYDNDLRCCEHLGVHGDMSRELEKALVDRPPATVLVVSVSALLPDAGPFSLGPAGALKAAIVKVALEHDIRSVIFVADYTKHVQYLCTKSGAVMFNEHYWKEDVLKKHVHQISIVTAPPPRIRALIASGNGPDARNRRLQNLRPSAPFDAQDYEYNRSAVALQEKVGGHNVHVDSFQSRFCEAYKRLLPRSSAHVCDVPRAELVFEIDPQTGFDVTDFRNGGLSKMLGHGIDCRTFEITQASAAENFLEVKIVGLAQYAAILEDFVRRAQSHGSQALRFARVAKARFGTVGSPGNLVMVK